VIPDTQTRVIQNAGLKMLNTLLNWYFWTTGIMDTHYSVLVYLKNSIKAYLGLGNWA
jgi:hypothetical protein